MISLLQQLIAIPSFSREEDAAADFLQAWLTEHGLEPRRSGNNLWCLKGSGPAVLADAHMDTVRPAEGWTRDPFRPALEDGRLYGLGANDDGGSLVALIHFFMQARPRKHTLVLSLSAQEEVSGRGGLEQALPLIEADAGPLLCGIIAEPTAMQAAMSEKGLMVLDCEALGVSAHAARDEGVNAIYQALPDMAWFREQGMQVTQIEAGTQHNVIPDRCRFVVDVRTTEDNGRVLSRIREKVKCRVVPRSTRLCGSRIGPEHPLAQAAVAAGLSTFASPTLSNQALCRFPTVKLGPGCSSRSHSADEFILVKELEEAVPLYLKFWQAYENLG